jgi:DNA-binding response OmpR family regulator
LGRRDVSVLLVDDDRTTADLYALKLRLDGLSVVVAHGYRSALELFDRERPGVACVDHRLPDGPGAELGARLAAQGTPVILLTNDQETFQRPPAGVRQALLKARTSPAELSAAVRGLLGS